jgi:hypothetical protein
LLQLVHVEFLNQSAVMDDAYPLCQARHFSQDMARHEDCDPLITDQFIQEGADFDNPRRVQSVRRFVKDYQFRMVQQRFGKTQALTVAMG